jgi:hypothetical protein
MLCSTCNLVTVIPRIPDTIVVPLSGHLLIPKTMKALVVVRDVRQTKQLYHDAKVEEKAIPALKKGEILVKVNAAGFNHRDVRFFKSLTYHCLAVSL